MDREQSEEERALQEGIERAVYLKLRDQFACAALMGLLTQEQPGHWDFTAKDAYRYADAMIQARSSKKETQP